MPTTIISESSYGIDSPVQFYGGQLAADVDGVYVTISLRLGDQCQRVVTVYPRPSRPVVLTVATTRYEYVSGYVPAKSSHLKQQAVNAEFGYFLELAEEWISRFVTPLPPEAR